MNISRLDVVGVKESGDMRVRSCLMLPNKIRADWKPGAWCIIDLIFFVTVIHSK